MWWQITGAEAGRRSWVSFFETMRLNPRGNCGNLLGLKAVVKHEELRTLWAARRVREGEDSEGRNNS